MSRSQTDLRRGLHAPTTPYTKIGDQLAVTRATVTAHGILIWHLCPVEDGWVATAIPLHTVPSGTDDLEHLTVRNSLAWSDCCGLHGYLTDGRWEPC